MVSQVSRIDLLAHTGIALSALWPEGQERFVTKILSANPPPNSVDEAMRSQFAPTRFMIARLGRWYLHVSSVSIPLIRCISIRNHFAAEITPLGGMKNLSTPLHWRHIIAHLVVVSPYPAVNVRKIPTSVMKNQKRRSHTKRSRMARRTRDFRHNITP